MDLELPPYAIFNGMHHIIVISDDYDYAYFGTFRFGHPMYNPKDLSKEMFWYAGNRDFILCSRIEAFMMVSQNCIHSAENTPIRNTIIYIN